MEMEYVLVHRGRRGQGFVYEMLYDGEGQDGKPFLMGLLDADFADGHLPYVERSGQGKTRRQSSPAVIERASSPPVRPQSARPTKPTSPNADKALPAWLRAAKRKTARPGRKIAGAS